LGAERRRYNLSDTPSVDAKQSPRDPSRHDFLMSQVGKLCRAGLSQSDVFELALALNEQRCRPPKPRREIEEMVHYAFSKEETKGQRCGGDAAAPERTIRTFEDIPLLSSFDGTNITFTVEGFLADGTLNLITGEPGCGKSTLACAIAGAVAEGKPIFERATRQRPVLYLDRENALAVVGERLKRIHVQDGENLRFFGPWCLDEPPGPSDPFLLEMVEAAVVKPLIIADSLVAFNRGDENDASAMRAELKQWLRLAQKGCCVVLLHHTGKAESAKHFRGSSDIKAVIDCGFLVTNEGGGGRLGTLRVSAYKSRFATDSNFTLRYANGVFEADGKPARTVNDVLADLLRTNPAIITGEFLKLAERNDVAKGKAQAFLRQVVREGRVDVEEGARNAKYYTWVEETGFEATFQQTSSSPVCHS
jgi:hypothetical protein